MRVNAAVTLAILFLIKNNGTAPNWVAIYFAETQLLSISGIASVIETSTPSLCKRVLKGSFTPSDSMTGTGSLTNDGGKMDMQPILLVTLSVKKIKCTARQRNRSVWTYLYSSVCALRSQKSYLTHCNLERPSSLQPTKYHSPQMPNGQKAIPWQRFSPAFVRRK